MVSDNADFDAVVIGGGLAGLSAGAYLARAGHRVAVLERSERPGGRAQTKEANGFLYNQGPHALYPGGEATEVLAELGVDFTGGTPNVAGTAIRNGRLFALPAGGRSLMTTRLFGVRDRVEAARLFLAFRKLAKEPAHGVSVAEWLDNESRPGAARQYVEALVRLACYADAPETIDVTDAARHLTGATTGVLYIDGGWRMLVDGLRLSLETAGGVVEAGSRAERIEERGAHRVVHLADGRTLMARAVVAAVGPAVAADLLPENAALRDIAARAVPARAACLDVSVSKMPVPRRKFALGIDQPYYYSLHTGVAKLAPAGMHTLSVAKYLRPDAPHDPAGSLGELESTLDLLQPGWREVEVGRQFLPEMVVTTSVSNARTGGLAGRPGPTVESAPGVFVAGDWVGSHGWLADATLGSAREAARLAGAHLVRTVPELATVS